MTFLIRRAEPSDLDAIADIEVDADSRYADSAHPQLAQGEPIPRDVVERAIAQGRVLAATDGPDVAGFVLLTRSQGELCIGQISVRSTVARQGIGTQLLRHVVAEAQARGEKSIVLNTQIDVPWNAPWYERHGFKAVDPVDWTDDMRLITDEQEAAGLDWTSRVHMRLELEPVRGSAQCDECGFDWETPSEELVAELASFGRAYETSLARLPGENVSVLREKPSPTVWSALEYTAHMRDVVDFYAERIHRVLSEEMPRLTAREFATLAEERKYNLEDPSAVLRQLAQACSSTATALSALTAAEWARAGVGSEGGERTVLVLARRLVHDGHHHLLDVRRVLDTVRAGN